MKKIQSALRKSPINYFSDLFVMAMVIVWIMVLCIMVIVAIYATVKFCDTAMWAQIAEVTTIPLSAGGAIWMIKNSVQHAIANSKGKEAPFDFPRVNAAGENDGNEVEVDSNKEEVCG